MLTIEGLEIETKVTALSQGEGFLVRVTTSWNMPFPDRIAMKKAVKQGLVGRILNQQEDTFADAQAAIGQTVDQFTTDIQAFIADYNGA